MRVKVYTLSALIYCRPGFECEIIMPRVRMRSEVYGSVFVYVCVYSTTAAQR